MYERCSSCGMYEKEPEMTRLCGPQFWRVSVVNISVLRESGFLERKGFDLFWERPPASYQAIMQVIKLSCVRNLMFPQID